VYVCIEIMMVLTPTQTFRRYEKAMHRFFRDVRVHRRKEFFAATSEDVHQFFDVVDGRGADEADECAAQWARVLEQTA
jgi:hypothetical protein